MHATISVLGQLYPQLHYWDTAAFFTLRIQILSFRQRNLEPQITEQFPNKRKNIKPGSWFKAIFESVQPGPAKTAEKAENHCKEGPLNATVGKSGCT